MSKLIEAIVNENFVEANHLFEFNMDYIREAKLYEVKRSLGEAQGKYGQYNDKADWGKYREKNPSMGFYDTPRGKVRPPRKLHKDWDKLASTKYGIAQKKKTGIKAHDFGVGVDFINKVVSHLKQEKSEREVKDAAAEKLYQASVKHRGGKKKKKESLMEISPALKTVAATAIAGAREAEQLAKDRAASKAKRREGGISATGQYGQQSFKSAPQTYSTPGVDNYFAQQMKRKGGTIKTGDKTYNVKPRKLTTMRRLGNTVRTMMTGKRWVDTHNTEEPKTNVHGYRDASRLHAAKEAGSIISRSRVGRAAKTAGRLALGGVRGVATYLAATQAEEAMNENIGFSKPRRSRIVRKRPNQLTMRKRKNKKNKYHVVGSETSKIQTSTATGIGLH